MAEFPALPVFTDALLADTAHLDHAEMGLYMRLLILMWRTPGCSVPNDPAWIAKRLNTPFEAIEPILTEFCVKTGNRSGRITQKRLLKEFTYLRDNSKKQSQRALQRWHPQDGDLKTGSIPSYSPDLFDKALETNDLDLCRSDAGTMPPTPPHLEDKKEKKQKKKVGAGSAYSPGFEEAWRTYRTSVTMSKAKSWAAWQKAVTERSEDELIEAIKAYNRHLDANGTEQKFVAHMTTFLNERRYEGLLAVVEQKATAQADDAHLIDGLQGAARALFDKIGAPLYRSWFKDVVIVEQPSERPGAKAFALRFPTGFMAQYCNQHHKDAVISALAGYSRSKVDVFFEHGRAAG